MNWNALKNGKCPSCGGLLKDKGILVICSKCTFKARSSRVAEILKDVPRGGMKYKPKTEEESLEALNNMGHDEMSEDFSDSSALDY